MELRLDLPVEALHCLHRDSLAERITERVRAEGLPEGAAVEVRGEPADAGHWLLRVSLSVGQEQLGTRELVVAEQECRAVVDALALVVVVALRGAEAARSSSASEPDWPRPDRTGTVSGDAEPTEPSAAQLAPQRRPPAGIAAGWGVRMLGGLGGNIGTSGPAAAVATVGWEVSRRGGPILGVSASSSFPSSVQLGEGELTFSTMLLRASACMPAWASGGAIFDGCITASGGVLHTGARGFQLWNGSSDDLLLAAGGSGRLRVALWRPLFLHLQALVDLHVLRPEIVIRYPTGAEALSYDAPFVTASALAGLGIHFE